MTSLREVIPNRVWSTTTRFLTFGIVPVNNNGIVVLGKEKSGSNVLIAVNAPLVEPVVFSQVHDLETKYSAKLKWIVETDWHHLYSKMWSKEFNDAVVLFPSTRGWRFYENDTSFPKMILNREKPEIPDMDESTIQLIPFLGFDGPFTNHPEDKRRGEYSVYLPDLQFLFIFDILLPYVKFWFYPSRPGIPRKNFNSLISGFQPVNKELCKKSGEQLLGLKVKTICFAHGDFEYGALVEGEENAKAALSPLNELLNL